MKTQRGALLKESVTIRVVKTNPKRPKSASYRRFERYKGAQTVAQFFALGGTRDDLRHDLAKGFVKQVSIKGVRVVGSKENLSPFDDSDDSDTNVWNAATEVEDDDTVASIARERGLWPAEAELGHMIQFFLCQLRWQYGMVVSEKGDFDAFDAEMSLLDHEMGSRDVASCTSLMADFFRGPARGDRWVPWHTVTCDQELFLMQRVRRLSQLSEEERCMACFAFSACRCLPLWEEIVVPYLQSPLEPSFFAQGSSFHARLVEYRKRGHKLHTSAFNCYPPRGASGDAFVDFIADRHVHFAAIGRAAYPLLSSKKPNAPRGPKLMDALDRLFRSFRRVGPTMSKVLLVTCHLWWPHLAILDRGCEVGDGARQAFAYLYPNEDHHTKRRALLKRLHAFLRTKCPDHRLPHMIAWLAKQTRAKFPIIPPDSIAGKMTIYDLQVQLCEWRKFRKSIDTKRTIGKHIILKDT